MRLQRWRALLPAAPKRERVPARPRIDSRRDRAPRQSVVAQLSQQPNRRDVDLSFFQDAVKFCLKHDVILAHDSAYSEIAYDGYRSPSVFSGRWLARLRNRVPLTVQTFSMTGWRVGFAIGNPQLIGALGKVKTNMDSGVFQAVQEAAITGLAGGDGDRLAEYCAIYKQRRDLLVPALRALGLECENPRATFYVWTKVPRGYTSGSFTERVLKEAGIAITPAPGSARVVRGTFAFLLRANGWSRRWTD